MAHRNTRYFQELVIKHSYCTFLGVEPWDSFIFLSDLSKLYFFHKYVPFCHFCTSFRTLSPLFYLVKGHMLMTADEASRLISLSEVHLRPSSDSSARLRWPNTQTVVWVNTVLYRFAVCCQWVSIRSWLLMQRCLKWQCHEICWPFFL